MTPEGRVIESAMTGRPTSGCWRDATTPKDGWVWEGCIDLGEYPGERCEMCLRERPQFIHTVHHDQGGTKRVGKVCAAWMCEDERPKDTERQMRNRLARLATRDREHREATDQCTLDIKRVTKIRDKARADEHPDMAKFDALVRDVEARVFAERWRACVESPAWESRQGGGRQLEFADHRAWVYFRDGRWRAGFSVSGRGAMWVRTNYANWEPAAEAALFRLEQELRKAGLLVLTSSASRGATP